MKIRIEAAAPLLLAAALTAPMQAMAADAVNVLTAENFYGDLAQQIGGDHVKVSTVLSNPDEDPHLFETSPSTARDIAGASIVIYNGADYDPWMEGLLSASPKPDRTAIVAADLVGAKSGDNPHLWYKPATFPAVAKALEAELEQRDPGDAKDFRANLAKFNDSLKPITDAIAAIKSAHAGEKVTATEPVFGYMAEALGFDMLNGDFQTVVMNEGEPSPSQVAAFEKSLSDGSAKILFYSRMERLFGLRETGELVHGMIIHEMKFEENAHFSAAFRELREKTQGITAFFCAHDGLALTVVSELLRLGYRVPEDMTVVGFGDFTAARQITPQLTTVRLPGRDMGIAAVRLLVDRIRLGNRNVGVAQRLHVVPEIIERESSGPRRASNRLPPA